MDLKNYNNFLSENEKKTLKLVNDKSNILTEKNTERKNIFNKTVKDIVTEWSLHHQKMLEEGIKVTKEMNDPKIYKNYQNWWDFLLKYLGDFVAIVTKEERLIYSGITLIGISLLLYLIDSSH